MVACRAPTIYPLSIVLYLKKNIYEDELCNRNSFEFKPKNSVQLREPRIDIQWL